ncbi:DUF4321 domain-containing protein [Paenibacillus sp. NEAU-GSW1]|uniref:DUF4321 domain-containing protein n=1 Tax=Paenibacillus sp. NEAU-GSW1 TaxID=2682486 RepID=UPI0012E18796|nr:DUF4321 domain-containing protein [Paenibacillus sp. NEAU-GSW1]MUT64522.1 DUF4321 domain-containing protein [Paenibacillus sp. NEAU-GSW1]
MKKNGWILMLFLILGLLAGALLSRSLEPVAGLSFLTDSIDSTWSPAFDLYVLRLDLTIRLNVSLLSIIGAAAALWLYRKI